jgi:predicted TIM-barrel fold metal-dependent hydrolase
MTIVDTHAHFWNLPSSPDPAMPGYGDEPLTPEALLQKMDDTGVDKLIEVTRTIQGHDNSFSIEGAAQHPDRIRVLGRFDPFPTDMPARLAEYVQQPYIVGIRIWWPDIDVGDPALEPFWAECEKTDVAVSLYGPGQAKAIGDIGRRHPGLRLIADHVAVAVYGPDQPSERFARWPDVLDLASVPNIHIKVSGLPEATNESYPFPEARGYLRQVYERFGPDRLMWGSNYPVTLRVCSYREAIDLIREQCDFIPDTEKAAILGGTAIRVLRLPW